MHCCSLFQVLRKLEQADLKTSAKRAQADADREARKTRRKAMAVAVAEARAEAAKMRAARGFELVEKVEVAFAKHSKVVNDVKVKSACQVKHAVAVVEARKEKERLDALAAGEKLSARLESAAAKRAAAEDSPRGSPMRRHQVLNDVKVASEMRRKSYAASMEAHVSKRDAFIQGVAEKAKAENVKAAGVAARRNAGSPEAKAALYHKLIRADVQRNAAIAAIRAKAISKERAADAASVIVVKLDGIQLRLPPPALSLRLSVVGTALVATATARQAGAAARRAALRAAAHTKVAKANERRAAALTRVGKAQAAVEAKVKAGHARSLISMAIAEGQRLANAAAHSARLIGALGQLAAAEDARKVAGAAAQAKVDAAGERRAATLRQVAKAGIVAVRAAAFKSRREALRTAVISRVEALANRGVAATERRSALLAKRVETARKHMTATHAKRVVEDMEIKEAASKQ